MPECPIRCLYLDPPYPGCARFYSVEGTPEFHPDAMRFDDPAEHVKLMEQAQDEFPDGWALSTGSNAQGLKLADVATERFGAKVGVWCKPAAGRLGLFRIAFAWEPVIYRTPTVARFAPGGTALAGRPCTVDWVMASVGHNSDLAGVDFKGAKPRRFAFWMFMLLGLGGHPEDSLVDAFPGSGAVTRAWDDFRAARVSRAGVVQRAMFESRP